MTCPEHHARGDCPGCIASRKAMAEQMRENFAKLIETQRAWKAAWEKNLAEQDPIKTTVVVKLNNAALARSVNTWNAQHPKGFDPAVVHQVAAAGVIRHRWSWWRFTLTVR